MAEKADIMQARHLGALAVAVQATRKVFEVVEVVFDHLRASLAPHRRALARGRRVVSARPRERRGGRRHATRGSPSDDPSPSDPPRRWPQLRRRVADSGWILALWDMLPVPAWVRCWLFLHAPRWLQRRAGEQQAERIAERNRAMLAAASDPDGLEHVGAVLGRWFQ